MTACSLCGAKLGAAWRIGGDNYCDPCMGKMMRWLAEASQGRITAGGSLVIGAGVEEPAKEPSASVSLELPLQERGADVLCIECQTPGMPRTLCNACRHKQIDRLEEAKAERDRLKGLFEQWKDRADVLIQERDLARADRADLVAAAADHLKTITPLSQTCECVLCTAARAEMDRRVRAVTAPPESTLTIQTGECGTCGGWKWGHRGPGLHPFAPCPEEERDDPNLRHGPFGYCAPCPACNKTESRG